ncbi:MAG: hypothetical protein AAF604_10390 [Acidobacteriota bacterium]
MKRRIIFCLALALSTFGCASSAIPAWPEDDDALSSGRDLLERSVAAHRGDVFADLQDLSVSYDGRWGRIVPRLQPVLVDRGFRASSQERYLLPSGTVFQLHTGPQGEKTVLRRPDDVLVSYAGTAVPEVDEERQAASALVADAYLMMITGPSYFLRPAAEIRSLPAAVEDGQRFLRLRARLRPGFGLSPEDRAVLWIDPETFLLRRVEFSIEGLESTRGAEVDVTFSGHREMHGKVWPTRFVERVRRPVSVFAHRWSLVGLDVDRGLTLDDLAPTAITEVAKAPAGAPLVAVSDRRRTDR